MKVFQLIDDLGVGGAQTVVVELVAGLERLGVEVEVVSLAAPVDSPATSWLTDASIPLHHLPPKGSRGLLDPRLLELRRLLNDRRPAVVHAHLDYAMVAAAIATRAHPTRVAATIHNTRSVTWNRGGIPRRLIDWAADHTDMLIACGQRVQDNSPLAAGRNVTVLPNPAPDPPCRSDLDTAGRRRELAVDGAGTVIVTVSRLSPRKGIDRAIGTVAELRRRGHSVELAVIGDGPERERLEAAAEAAGGVRFLGWRSDVADLLTGADVLLFPSDDKEGMPMAVLEAMQAGVAVVASAAGDLEMALSDGRGAVVEPPEVDALVSATESLLDPEARRPVTDRAREWVRRERSVDAWAAATIELYGSGGK